MTERTPEVHDGERSDTERALYELACLRRQLARLRVVEAEPEREPAA